MIIKRKDAVVDIKFKKIRSKGRRNFFLSLIELWTITHTIFFFETGTFQHSKIQILLVNRNELRTNINKEPRINLQKL